MTRPRKQTVDYFPHDCKHGETLFVLEQRYGNDGYAFWFKLLELIGSTEQHHIDCNKKSTWEYLTSRAHVTPEIGWEIMNLLADLEAIDSELWESKIVWIEKFVIRVHDAYRNRLSEIPMRPDFLRQKPPEPPQSSAENPQTKLKETKEKEIKDIPTKTAKGNGRKKAELKPLPENFSVSDAVKAWAKAKGFNHLEDHLEAFKDRAIMKDYRYVDWDRAFMTAIREDWGKIRSGPRQEERI